MEKETGARTLRCRFGQVPLPAILDVVEEVVVSGLAENIGDGFISHEDTAPTTTLRMDSGQPRPRRQRELPMPPPVDGDAPGTSPPVLLGYRCKFLLGLL